MDDGASASRLSRSEIASAGEPLASSADVRAFRKPAKEPTNETQSAPAPRQSANDSQPAKRRRRLTRPLLFALLPVALVAGGYWYVTGGATITTDNAYIAADTVGVSTDVSGTVVAISVKDNQEVKKGQILFRLKPDTFETALAAAQAQLGTVRSQVLTLHADYRLALAQIRQAQADIPYYQLTYRRQQTLAARGAASKAALDQAQHDLLDAEQKVAVAKAEANAALAQLDGDPNQPVDKNPFYIQASSAVADAKRNLADTVVRAAFAGIVTKVSALQVGSYLKASQPGFSLVSDQNIWVDASPKETALTHVHQGQAAIVTVDAYPGVQFHGRVESISPASASSFSLLPAQNTTGNWVKVVQRIPMRVKIDNPDKRHPLRVGMSATVAIDTHHPNGLPPLFGSLGGGAENHG